MEKLGLGTTVCSACKYGFGRCLRMPCWTRWRLILFDFSSFCFTLFHLMSFHARMPAGAPFTAEAGQKTQYAIRAEWARIHRHLHHGQMDRLVICNKCYRFVLRGASRANCFDSAETLGARSPNVHRSGDRCFHNKIPGFTMSIGIYQKRTFQCFINTTLARRQTPEWNIHAPTHGFHRFALSC